MTGSSRRGCSSSVLGSPPWALSLVLAILSGVAVAGECFEKQKLTASDANSHRFGSSVSVSGNVAVVGAPTDHCPAGEACGSAYVFRYNGSTWVEEQKLTASNAAARDYFGHSVSLIGNVAIVGAPSDFSGSAYVFRHNGSTWVEEQEFFPSEATASAHFGWSVSFSGDVAVVGAYGDGCAAGARCGSAYVYRYNGTTWVGEQRLTAADAAMNDDFGFSVSLNGNVAVVGAIGDACNADLACGAAYVFRYNGSTWAAEQKLTARYAAYNDQFGSSVAVSGDVVLIGAEADDCAIGLDCGSAYIFRYNGTTWMQRQRLTASDARASASFGLSVSVSGDVAVVGASGDDCAFGSFCGSAYVFRNNGISWVEELKLTASASAMNTVTCSRPAETATSTSTTSLACWMALPIRVSALAPTCTRAVAMA